MKIPRIFIPWYKYQHNKEIPAIGLAKAGRRRPQLHNWGVPTTNHHQTYDLPVTLTYVFRFVDLAIFNVKFCV